MQNFVLDREKNSGSNSAKNPLSVKASKYLNLQFFKDYLILGPLGRGAASFVYKIQSRKDKKELVFFIIGKENKFRLRL